MIDCTLPDTRAYVRYRNQILIADISVRRSTSLRRGSMRERLFDKPGVRTLAVTPIKLA